MIFHTSTFANIYEVIMAKMGATALVNERIVQAAGRCKRALQDRLAIFLTGIELVDFPAYDRKRKHLHPVMSFNLFGQVCGSAKM
jgi:hypothetical protein